VEVAGEGGGLGGQAKNLIIDGRAGGVVLSSLGG
jgi:hypothetical protein